MRAGVVDILAHELHREDDDASCRKRAIAALINLSFVMPTDASLFEPALLSRLALLKDRPGLADHVCALQHNLSVVREQRPELVRAGLLTPELLERFDAHQRAGLRRVTGLSTQATAGRGPSKSTDKKAGPKSAQGRSDAAPTMMGGPAGRPMQPGDPFRYEESFAERAARQHMVGGGEAQPPPPPPPPPPPYSNHGEPRHHRQREQPYPPPQSRQSAQPPPVPSLHNQTPDEIAAARAAQMLLMSDVRDDLGDPDQCRNQ